MVNESIEVSDDFYNKSLEYNERQKEINEHENDFKKLKEKFILNTEREIGFKIDIPRLERDSITIKWEIPGSPTLTRKDLMKITEFKPFKDFMFLNLKVLFVSKFEFYATYIQKATT